MSIHRRPEEHLKTTCTHLKTQLEELQTLRRKVAAAERSTLPGRTVKGRIKVKTRSYPAMERMMDAFS